VLVRVCYDDCDDDDDYFFLLLLVLEPLLTLLQRLLRLIT
jgi:hypothetical protein